ncbi:hypothetical protein IFM89_030422 [Coptis chinensis]|uniref:RING-type E3 ubiquitin transferase n=1 Tax=Coptis chinensis TaxID=261450 RepID=A0A835I0V4_9MAGN|nr:hypothetical protein IFM89_030422 [Coptis chinensis]
MQLSKWYRSPVGHSILSSNAKSVPISDLRSLLDHDQDAKEEDNPLVVVRGFVQSKSLINVLVSHVTGASENPGRVERTHCWPLLEGEGSLPATTAHQHLQPVNTPYTLIQALFGCPYPVGLLDEEKILPLGKEIGAVGIICSSQEDGNTQIKPCKELPYFLTGMTQDQMVAQLTSRSNLLFWSCIVLGTVSVGSLGYVLFKYWRRMETMDAAKARLARM